MQREWVAIQSDLGPLQLVPTEYYTVDETPYQQRCGSPRIRPRLTT
jgi:hyaluronoglucosaminidase